MNIVSSLMEMFDLAVLSWVIPFGFGSFWFRRILPGGPRQQYLLGFLTGGAVLLISFALHIPRPIPLFLLLSTSFMGVFLYASTNWKIDRSLVATVPIGLIAGLYCASDLITRSDAWSIWYARVPLLENWVSLKDFAEYETTHPAYPFLGSTWWWFFQHLSKFNPELIRIVFLTPFLILISELGSGFKHKKTFTLLATFFLFNLHWVSGYQDGLVGIFIAALAWFTWKQKNYSFLAFAPLIGLIKTEGSVLALILICSFLFTDFVSNRLNLRKIWKPLVGAGVLFFIWPVCLKLDAMDIRSVQNSAISGITITFLTEHMGRIPKILCSMWTMMPIPQLLVAFLFYVSSLLKPAQALRNPFFLFSVLHIAFLTFVFWTTHYDFEWHLNSALDRLLLQGSFIHFAGLIVNLASTRLGPKLFKD